MRVGTSAWQASGRGIVSSTTTLGFELAEGGNGFQKGKEGSSSQKERASEATKRSERMSTVVGGKEKRGEERRV